MSRAEFSIALSSSVHDSLSGHLLQHLFKQNLQEDLCFALWFPSVGRTRFSALITEVILPQKGDRGLHGNTSFNSQYLERVLKIALSRGAGIAFLHNHLTAGWQGMSADDVVAEQRLAPRAFATTGMPLVGLTIGTDGAWSARVWKRTGRNEYTRHWCATVRVVGAPFQITYMENIAPTPKYREELLRTYSAWGASKQASLARLRVGVIGLGSVGAIVAEALARMGIEDILLMDFDTVKKHNLDRLLHATVQDIGKLKIDIAKEHLAKHATAEVCQIEALPLSITKEDGFRAALDCDVLFSCVDRPWPRNVLNHIAYSHLIPVIDGGIIVRVKESGLMRGADWRAHIAMPGRPCLECLGQFDPADVSLERSGLLDDPSYIRNLPKEHFVHRNENVFGFSMNCAGLQILQLLAMVVQPSGLSDPVGQIYHFVTGNIDREQRDGCKEGCLYPSILSKGDHSGFTAVESITPGSPAQ